ncbi:MAG: Hsp70 family protein, partial [Planctomycetales bacterium]|nr:Hsp70 family protein [Planctomycetales bacterium]
MKDSDAFADSSPSRFVVGIDLGTTNSAVCYVDTDESPWKVRTLSIPQLVSTGQVESRETLPSFHYQPTLAEQDGGVLQLPWKQKHKDGVVGVMARDQGTSTPGRVIGSAKSWLCHSGVDRTAELLPWQGSDEVQKLSPVSASSRYLQHVREAWDHQFRNAPLADQDIVLTLPASFDEVARELTVAAAKEAGLPRVVLIEEPQAAFYAWVDAHRKNWSELVQPGQKILVCDVGGGTSDFTLIRVRTADSADEKSQVQFHRIAVGEHLILGGDNLDLALAHHIEQRLTSDGKQLQPRQWDSLVRNCRIVKETLLGENAPDKYTVHLSSGGSKLIGGGIQVVVNRDEVEQVLVDGFFPQVPLDSKPQNVSGFQEFGLPYAADAAVTRYLAAFLSAHRHADKDISETITTHDPARPDLILFNGGLFASPDIRERIINVVATWFSGEDHGWSPTVLQNARLDLAVARGAAYYGMVRRGEGVRIAAGLARSYYIGVDGGGNENSENAPAALCVIPGRAQPGETIDLPDRVFDLRISEPVEFPLYVSSVRLADEPGDLLAFDPEQLKILPPIRTAIKTRRKTEKGTIPVTLHARLSEIGTIEMWCSQVDSDRTWRLQFDVRSATETDRVAVKTKGEQQGTFDDEIWTECRSAIKATFGQEPTLKPNALVKQLTSIIGAERSEWPMPLLRQMWETLVTFQDGRKHSQSHESRWLNLVGYTLRPGYGMSVDDWRVTETWRLVQGKLAFNSQQTRNESWILWRRIAGGLSEGQQRAFAEPTLASVRSLHRRMTGGSVKGEVNFTLPESAELWRLLGGLELLAQSTKREVGRMILDILPKRKCDPVRPA